MIRKLKLAISTLIIVFSSSAILMPAISAADSVNTSDACAGLNTLQKNTNGSTCDQTSESQLSSIISFVVQTLSWVLGIAAIIVIILSGFKYITSGGDSAKIGSAKQTLIYALIGLVVAALAQVLVHFVFNTTNNAITPCPGQPTISNGDANCKNPN